LYGANLSDAFLNNANLSDTNLNNANLRGANLEDVIFCKTLTPWGEDSSGCNMLD